MKEYRIILQYQRQLASKAFFFLFVGFPALYQLSPCLLLPYFGFFIIGVILAIVDIYEQRIVINQQGIMYYGVGFAIEVEWKNFMKIDADFLLGEEGLFVSRSHVIAKFQYFNLKPYKGFREKFFVPLSRFQKNWRDSELGQQIKQYAPHLFEKVKSVQPA